MVALQMLLKFSFKKHNSSISSGKYLEVAQTAMFLFCYLSH